ncbi:3-(3-hydroxyphenyl)propionate hydroxylase [Rhodococcus sp. ACS1]|uniref:bifunctional 3-(3-hydroxy-phenyl)propionate/3-hydroxycinnamic acid hydroxylase MhpA n=1 Tax=Rhodococcus sp. ACS1 TaxID=2028570 RepID=UPI000BB1428B|nr:bifunctional 3-(3-hydroxy-phenyl)propionate/3-hydroxycinnamic acid hydroxylase [Rhodococcus sp. ACS1]PBC36811.1 3-(3-hydroxyphenyl)propionate hydroxylase [Rhodococcus sp. ACS1]
MTTTNRIPPTVPVLIVGGGPTGLTTANLLSRYGIESIVLERHRGPYPLPRAVHLDDEVLRILQTVDAAAEITRISRRALGMRLVDAELRTLVEIRRDRPVGLHGWPETNMFDQPDLEQVLRTNLEERAANALASGCEAVRVQRRPNGTVDVTIRDTRTGHETVTTARYVLGCDGANSMVRSAIGTGTRDLGFTQRWLVVDAEYDHDLGMWPGVHQVCAGVGSATFMQIGDNRYRWEFRLPDESRFDSDDDISPADVRDLLEPWVPAGDTGLRVLRHTIYSHRARVARTWRRGPLLLLGDAAHLTPPFIGQGLGAGQRDAMNLAWKLAAVLDGHADDRLLDTYEPERSRHVVRAIRAATAIGRIMATRPTRPVRAGHAVLRRASALPGPDALATRVLAPPLRGSALTPSVLALPSYRTRTVGTPIPQDVLDDETGTGRTDSVLGPGFALVCAGKPPHALADVGRRLDAKVVTSRSLAGSTGEINRWMRRNHLTEVLVRPDRIVLAAVDRRGRMSPTTSWLPLLTGEVS